MGGEEVKLLGNWASPFVLRVQWALKLKGIQYEYIEEDLQKKSSMLLQYNPRHRKVPVLVHKGKPVLELLVILEYIDETRKHNPLLPQDPLVRAKDCFWVNFADEKISSVDELCMQEILATFHKIGEEKEKSVKEARTNLKILESGLEGKRFFGGETIGFVDVAASWIGYWAQIIEEMVDVKLIDEENIPLLTSWFKDILYKYPFLKNVCHLLTNCYCTTKGSTKS